MGNWEIYYCCGFATNLEDEPAGTEIPVNQDFVWDNEDWTILSLYEFDEGPVVDLCKKIDIERSLKYHMKWNSAKPFLKDFPREKLDEMIRDNPFRENLRPVFALENVNLEFRHCASACFDPMRSKPYAADDVESMAVRHYNLDNQSAWAFYRISWAWPNSQAHETAGKTMTLTLDADSTPLYDISFAAENGMDFDLTHPLTKDVHHLHILASQWETVDIPVQEDYLEYPKNVMTLTYTLSPDLPSSRFAVKDRSEGDAPRLTWETAADVYPDACADVGFITCGESRDGDDVTHCDTSSLYFSTDHKIQWRAVFMEKLKKDVVVSFRITK